MRMHDSDAWVQHCWLSGARAACTAATRFADVAALAIAGLSTTEACDAISMGGWRKKRGACDTGAGKLFGAPGMLGNRPAVQTRAQVLANAIALRAAWVLAAVNRAQHTYVQPREAPPAARRLGSGGKFAGRNLCARCSATNRIGCCCSAARACNSLHPLPASDRMMMPEKIADAAGCSPRAAPATGNGPWHTV